MSGEVADLNEIDEAGKHKQDKKTFLEKMLTDKDFKEFTDEILTALGFLKDGVFSY